MPSQPRILQLTILSIGVIGSWIGSGMGDLEAQESPAIAAPLVASNSKSPRVTTDPNILVYNAVQQAVFGPPLAAKVYQQSLAYGQQVILSGEYKSFGSGTGQFRYTARLSSGETTLDSIQVSDGRLMYTQIDKQPPRIVNVEKIREKLTPKLHQLQQSPEVVLHLAVGGHAELLRNLYQRYHWYEVAEGTISGIDVWQLVGQLRTEPPRIAGTARIDRENLAVQPQNEGLPTAVRLTLGRSSAFPYFPYSVVYFRVKKDKEGRPQGHVPVSVIKYNDPTSNVTFQESDFLYRPDASTDKTIWETDLYDPAT